MPKRKLRTFIRSGSATLSGGDAITVDTTPPSVPQGVTASAISSSQITLSWSASTDSGSGVQGYEVLFVGSGQVVSNVLATSYTANNLLPNTSYGFQVRAKDNSGNLSGYSSQATATTQSTGTVAATFASGYDETYYVAESSTNGWRSFSDTVTGWDWSYPPTTTVAPVSGVFRFSNTQDYPVGFLGKKIYKINADWRDLEPTEGNYNFSLLDQLATLSSYWDGVQIDVRGIVKDSTSPSLITAPTWLAGRGIQEVTTTLSDTGATNVSYNIAHLEYNVPHRLLIDAIAAHVTPDGYKVPAHPRLSGQIVHGGGTFTAGEEQGFGFAATNADPSYYKTTLERWAIRYKPPYQTSDFSYKLEWVGQHGTAADMVGHRVAIDAGMGTRGGIMEKWLEGNKTPRKQGVYTGQALEQYFSATGTLVPDNYYLILDDTDPRKTTVRWHGDQNEEYRTQEANAGDYGGTSRWQQQYRMSTLRTIQMGLNNTAMEPKNTALMSTAAIDGREGYVNPAIARWLSVQLGKRKYSASDLPGTETNEAWCCFFRGWVKTAYFDASAPAGQSGGTYANPQETGSTNLSQIHNLERFLTQREGDGATTLTLNVELGWTPSGGSDALVATYPQLTQMSIGRTGSSIGLRLDNAMRFTGAVAIKVTYFDNNANTWSLQYTTAGGTASVSRTNTNTNRVKTTTFFVNDFANTANAVNVRLIDSASTKTPFMFVRVIKP